MRMAYEIEICPNDESNGSNVIGETETRGMKHMGLA